MTKKDEVVMGAVDAEEREAMWEDEVVVGAAEAEEGWNILLKLMKYSLHLDGN